ncbi:hypothetical protein GCM10010446_11300 [Streptomyces enissocaesilis]|uniref:Uncharacterized protein n=1 Tax=Streptomyces enissocaesilis TaxID=332589 RepID=A0ABN3WXF6_9ACTN
MKAVHSAPKTALASSLELPVTSTRTCVSVCSVLFTVEPLSLVVAGPQAHPAGSRALPETADRWVRGPAERRYPQVGTRMAAARVPVRAAEMRPARIRGP